MQDVTSLYSGWVALHLAVGVLAYLLWAAFRKRPAPAGLKHYDELPGPTELPFIRSLLQVYMGPRPQINKLWTRIARTHGPLCKFRIPGKNFVVVADHKLLPAVLGRPGLPKTSIYSLIGPLFNPYGHDNLFTITDHNTPEWKVVRKAFATSMSAERIRTYFPIAQSRTLALCEQLRLRGPGAMDAQHAMERLALDVVMKAGFDLDHTSVDFSECEILDSIHYCFNEIFRRVTRPWRRALFWACPWLPSARENRMMHDKLYGAWGKICDSIRDKRPFLSSDPSFLATIAMQRDLTTGEYWSREKLMAHVGGVVVAGMDTTAHAVSWALFCVATYPGVQERLSAELAAAGLLASAKQPQPRELEFSDIFALPILEAVIKESMRMFPVGGSGIGRYADKDINLGGYWIPKGTEVAVCLHTLHNVPWHFPEPDTFKLERWLAPAAAGEEGGSGEKACSRDSEEQEEGDKIAALRSTPAETSGLPGSGQSGAAEGRAGRRGSPESAGAVPKGARREKRDALNTRARKEDGEDSAAQRAYIPFSYGPRDCLGQRLGMMEVQTMLAGICGRFRVELAECMGGEAGVLDRQISNFTLSVDGGLFMHFHDRAQDACGVDRGAEGKQAGAGAGRPVFNISARTA